MSIPTMELAVFRHFNFITVGLCFAVSALHYQIFLCSGSTEMVLTARRPRPPQPTQQSSTSSVLITTSQLILAPIYIDVGRFMVFTFPQLQVHQEFLKVTDSVGSSLTSASMIQPFKLGSWFVLPPWSAEGVTEFYVHDTRRMQDLSFQVIVSSPPEPKTHIFHLELAIEPDIDVTKTRVRASIMSSVASIFGDRQPNFMQTVEMQSTSDKVLVFKWYNISYNSQSCPVYELKNLVKNLIDQNGHLTRTASIQLNADLEMMTFGKEIVLDVGVDGIGPCLHENVLDDPHFVPTRKPVSTIFTVIIPSLIILVMILISLVIACYLRKLRNKRKPIKLLEPGTPAMSRVTIPLMFVGETAVPDINSNALDCAPGSAVTREIDAPPPPPPYSPASTLRRF